MLVGSTYATEKVIRAKKDKLNVNAEALLTRETVNYQDIAQLAGSPTHAAKK